MTCSTRSPKPSLRRHGRAAYSVVALALVLGTVSCSASSKANDPDVIRLPYHVALSVASSDVYVDETPSDGRTDGAQVDLGYFASAGAGEDRIDFPGMVANELKRELFSKVTLLGEATCQGEQVAQAKASGADLLMTVHDLSYDTRAESKHRYWNWFWFFTGPFEFLFNDREFRVNSTVEVELYELNQLPDPLGMPPAQLVERIRSSELDGDSSASLVAYRIPASALVRRFRARPGWTKTKFVDRAESGYDWAKCLLIPSGFLRGDGHKAQRKVAEKSFESLAAILTEQIAVDGEFVARPSHSDRLYLQGGTQGGAPRTTLREDGPSLFFEAMVMQREDSAERDFRVAEVRLGDRVFDLSDAQGTTIQGDGFQGSISSGATDAAPAGWVRKRIEITVPIAATYVGRSTGQVQVDPTLQLLLADELGAGQARSWTFDLRSEERGMVRAIEAALARGDTIAPRGGAFHTSEASSARGDR